MDHRRNLSRCSVLKGAALLAGAALAAGIVPSKEALAQRTSKDAMKYQDKPNGDKRCSNCLDFIPSGTCAIVEGMVSPDGYCLAWAKKT
jgi:hypothetical protein